MKMPGYVRLFNGKNSAADYTEISYYDEAGHAVAPDEASRILIRQLRRDGTVVKETRGYCGKPSKRSHRIA